MPSSSANFSSCSGVEGASVRTSSSSIPPSSGLFSWSLASGETSRETSISVSDELCDVWMTDDDDDDDDEGEVFVLLVVVFFFFLIAVDFSVCRLCTTGMDGMGVDDGVVGVEGGTGAAAATAAVASGVEDRDDLGDVDDVGIIEMLVTRSALSPLLLLLLPSILLLLLVFVLVILLLLPSILLLLLLVLPSLPPSHSACNRTFSVCVFRSVSSRRSISSA